jgi:hypothetical protein
VLGGLGINILTTPRGVMTGRDAHKRIGTCGGENSAFTPEPSTRSVPRLVRQNPGP